jgi:hypothetical protein
MSSGRCETSPAACTDLGRPPRVFTLRPGRRRWELEAVEHEALSAPMTPDRQSSRRLPPAIASYRQLSPARSRLPRTAARACVREAGSSEWTRSRSVEVVGEVVDGAAVAIQRVVGDGFRGGSRVSSPGDTGHHAGHSRMPTTDRPMPRPKQARQHHDQGLGDGCRPGLAPPGSGGRGRERLLRVAGRGELRRPPSISRRHGVDRA